MDLDFDSGSNESFEQRSNINWPKSITLPTTIENRKRSRAKQGDGSKSFGSYLDKGCWHQDQSGGCGDDETDSGYVQGVHPLLFSEGEAAWENK